MPTLCLKIDCEGKPSEDQIAELRNLIATYDYNLVLFEAGFSEETQINWDEYMSSTNVLSA